QASRHSMASLILLLRPLLVAGDEGAPGLRADRLVRLPHHVELAVALHFADEHRLPEMMVRLVHLQREAGRSREGLAGHRLANVGMSVALRPWFPSSL